MRHHICSWSKHSHPRAGFFSIVTENSSLPTFHLFRLGFGSSYHTRRSLSPLTSDVLLELINIPLAGTLTPVPLNMLENIGYAWAFVPGRINRVALEPAWRCLIGNMGGLHCLAASLASGCPCSAVRMQLLELGGRAWLCVWDGDWILRISFPLCGRHPG